MRQGTVILTVGLLLAAAATAGGQQSPRESEGDWLAMVGQKTAAAVAASAPGAPGETPCPMSFSVDYTLVTDYIWRGINSSEYRGEGREKLNHQLGVGFSYDAREFGAFGGLIWLEWYGGQEALTPGSNDHLQEVDYIAYWSYALDPIATTVETGVIFYQFPQVSGDPGCTHEWYLTLSFDDTKLFRTEESVLNPYVSIYIDTDDVKRGIWLELGVSHDFILAEMGCAETPFLKDLTISPSFVLGYDHRYMDKLFLTDQGTSKLHNMVYGLSMSYDLSGALGLPARFGALSVTGFLKFSDAVRDELIDDEFWGGVTFAWQW